MHVAGLAVRSGGRGRLEYIGSAGRGAIHKGRRGTGDDDREAVERGLGQGQRRAGGTAAALALVGTPLDAGLRGRQRAGFLRAP